MAEITPEPTDKVEPNIQNHPVGQTDQTDQTMQLEQTEQTEPTEQIEQAEQVKQTEQVKQDEKLKQPEQVKQTEQAEQIKQTEQVKQSEQVKRIEQVKQSEQVKKNPMQRPTEDAKPAPQRRRTVRSGQPSVTEYYIKLSRRLRVMKFLCIAAFVIFTITVVTFNRDRITIENFQYMMRYLDVDTSSYEGNVNRISYNADSNMKINVYRGDLAIARSMGITVKSPGGNIILDNTNAIAAPIPVPSEKYLLLYDLGGKQYALYNTFTCLHTGEYDYPITCAACSDSGMYALVTSSGEYRSVVNVYDKNFRQIARISKDKLVMDIAFNGDGSRLIVLSAYADGGDFCSEIQILDPYSDTPMQTVRLRDSFPMRVQWHNNAFSVIAGDGIRFYSEDGTLTAYRSYRKAPVAFASNAEYVAVVANDNAVGSIYQVQILNCAGESVFSGHISGKIITVTFSDHYAHVLTATTLCRIDLAKATMQSGRINALSATGLVAISDSVLFVTYATEAVSINADTFYEQSDTIPSEGITDLPTAITDTGKNPSSTEPDETTGAEPSETDPRDEQSDIPSSSDPEPSSTETMGG